MNSILVITQIINFQIIRRIAVVDNESQLEHLAAIITAAEMGAKVG